MKIESAFRVLVFVEERKPENPEKHPPEDEVQQQTQPSYDARFSADSITGHVEGKRQLSIAPCTTLGSIRTTANKYGCSFESFE